MDVKYSQRINSKIIFEEQFHRSIGGIKPERKKAKKAQEWTG